MRSERPKLHNAESESKQSYIAFEPRGGQSLENCYSLHPLAICLGALLVEGSVDYISFLKLRFKTVLKFNQGV